VISANRLVTYEELNTVHCILTKTNKINIPADSREVLPEKLTIRRLVKKFATFMIPEG
jgi:hypothetical protein